MKKVLLGFILVSSFIAYADEFGPSPEEMSSHAIMQKAGGNIFTTPKEDIGEGNTSVDNQSQEETKKTKKLKKTKVDDVEEKYKELEEKYKKYALMKTLMGQKDNILPSTSNIILVEDLLNKKQKGQTNTNTSQSSQQQGQQQDNSVMNQVFTEGYCTINDDILVKETRYATFQCMLKDIGPSEVFGQLIPDISQRSLKFKPIDVEKFGKRLYSVKSSLVLSGDRSSENIASEVNDRAIEKIIALSASNSAKQTTQAYQEYFQNKNSQIVVGSGGAVMQQNQYPASYPATMGLISLGSSLISSTADYINQQIANEPYIFKIDKGASVYVQLLLEPIKN